MQALVLATKDKSNHHEVSLQQIARPILRQSNQVLVKLQAAALNHRDLWILVGLYPAIVAGSVLGADGSGVVVTVNDSANNHLLNTDVVINPSINFGKSSFHILGMLPAPGTFGEYIAIDAQYVHPKPSHLSHAQAAALCLAGLTAYRAVVTKAQVCSGQNVLVTGIGGGVALFALQFCVALGANVYVTSSSEAKIAFAKELGAKGGFNYRAKNGLEGMRDISGGVHAVIDGAGGEELNTYIKYMAVGGVIAMYGATAGRCKQLDVTRLFLKQMEIRGTTMGSPQEFHDMLQLVSKHKIIPVVDTVFPLQEYGAAFARLKSGEQRGKVVLSMVDAPRL